MVNPNDNTNSNSYVLEHRNRYSDKHISSVFAPLLKLSKKHNIILPDSVILKLTAARVHESGEFEFIANARLAQIGIKAKEDRLKVLKLVKRYNNEELFEFRDSFDKAYERSQLQTHFYSLHQQRLSFVIQMPWKGDRVLYLCTLNGALYFHGRASATITSDHISLSIQVLEQSLSGLKKLKLREKELDNIFYRVDPVTRERNLAIMAKIIAKRDKQP